MGKATAVVKLYIKNHKKLEAEIKQISDAIQCLLKARVLLVSENVGIETLTARAGKYITGQIKIGVRA